MASVAGRGDGCSLVVEADEVGAGWLVGAAAVGEAEAVVAASGAVE